MVDTTTWVTLNSTVMHATEDECAKALEHELQNQRRSQFALRIFCRFNRLRTIRERKTILERLKNGSGNNRL